MSPQFGIWINYSSIFISVFFLRIYAQNLALFRPASQAATYEDNDILYGASLAVDGNYTTVSFTDTNSNSAPAWWRVELESDCLVGGVDIYISDEQAVYRQYLTITISVERTDGTVYHCADYDVRSVSYPDRLIGITCQHSPMGRFVIIRRNGGLSPRQLILGMVYVHGTFLFGDQAYGKETNQIGTFGQYNSSFAVNYDDFCAIAEDPEGSNAWWQVDLNDIFLIQSIRIQVGTDEQASSYCQDIIITVDDTNQLSSTKVCATYDQGPVTGPVQVELQCSQPLQGRYVTIRRGGSGNQPNRLGLCDVKVIGKFKGSHALYKPTSQINMDSTYGYNAVDQYINTCEVVEGPAGSLAWWRVDLEYMVNVTSIWIIVQTTDNANLYFDDVIITVDDSNTTNSQKICTRYPAGPSGGLVDVHLACTSPLEGRYVTIRRGGTGYQPNKLGLCDVKVIGDYIGDIYEDDSSKLSTKSGTSPGLIAGVVVGSVVVVAAIIFAVVIICFSSRKKRNRLVSESTSEFGDTRSPSVSETERQTPTYVYPTPVSTVVANRKKKKGPDADIRDANSTFSGPYIGLKNDRTDSLDQRQYTSLRPQDQIVVPSVRSNESQVISQYSSASEVNNSVSAHSYIKVIE